ncbi:MAG: hypothetical protein KDD58_01155 [Bdellovibrionales bacterium]|nr:hypothetical protein [Bdellovibrionales bacterium]
MKVNTTSHNIFFVPTILWIAMLFTVFIYNFIIISTVHGLDNINFSIDFSHEMTTPITAIAFLVLVSSYVLPNFLIKQTLKRFKIKDDHTSLNQILFVPFILRLVMLESIAIFGFVLSIIQKNGSIFYFSFIAIVGFLFNFPTEKKWINWIRKNKLI